MDKDILNEVIEAEKDIQQRLEAEQARIAAWLEQVRLEAEAAVLREERNSGEVNVRTLEAAGKRAAIAAQQVVDEAAREAKRLEGIDGTALAGIVMKRIPRILME